MGHSTWRGSQKKTVSGHKLGHIWKHLPTCHLMRKKITPPQFSAQVANFGSLSRQRDAQTVMKMPASEWGTTASYSVMTLTQEWGRTGVSWSKHCWDKRRGPPCRMVISHYDFLDSELLRPWQLPDWTLLVFAVVLHCERTVLLFACPGIGGLTHWGTIFVLHVK